MSNQFRYILVLAVAIAAFTYNLQAQNELLVKQTLSNGGGSFECSIQGANWRVQQCIGQASAIGSFTANERSVYQGFLTPKGLKLNSLQEEQLKVSLYPNPFTEHFTLEFDRVPESSIVVQVFDLSGRLVLSEVHSSASILSIDQINLQRGAYILNAQVGTSTVN